MDTRLAQLLLDPISRGPLTLQTNTSGDTRLVSADGASYSVRDGIPRFTEDAFEAQTQGSFHYKWTRQEAYEDDSVVNMIEHDEVPRWGLQSIDEFREIFRGPKTVLDAGCGSGHFASTYVPYVNASNNLWVGMDLTAAIDLAHARFSRESNARFVQGNLLKLPFKDGVFDVILCRGVMHHTPDQWLAFRNLAAALKPGGEFLFLIYRKMGPIREFTDTFIRNHLSKLSPAEAWEALRGLTELGKVFVESKTTITVPRDISYLEIPAGTYNLHDFIYNHVLKAYYSSNQGIKPELEYDYSQHNNFDWYHPQYATKATAADIRTHASAAGLEVTFLKDLYSSWAVRCRKQM